MHRKKRLTFLTGAALLVAAVLVARNEAGAIPPDPNPEETRIARGLAISPVPLRLRGKDRGLVALGSYIVNAQSGCNDCHTNPSFAEGGDPYAGEPIKINAAGFLAGGREFGPTIVSPNLTPDEDGLPAGLTFQQFKRALRTGKDPDDPDHILQVMPWPVFRNMSDRDLLAVYEYLRSIPHVE